MTMEAEMYGMIPNAKIEALENAPPENMFNKAKRPSLVCSCNLDSIFGSIPGRTIYEPNLYIATNNIVMRIRFLRSSIFHIFFNVSIDRLIELEFYSITTNSLNSGQCTLRKSVCFNINLSSQCAVT